MANARRRGNHEGSIVKRADGRWMASITIGRDPATGKLKRVCFYGKTRQQAADQRSHALSDLQRGTFVAPHKLTVGQWLETWLREYKRPKVRPLTFDNYERIVRCHLIPALGHLPLKELRPEHVQRAYNEQHQAGLSVGSIRVIHAVLRSALKQAMKHQLVLRNVTEAVTPSTARSRTMQPLSLQEVGHFLSVIADHRLFPPILLGLGTGLRRGELLALRWQDVDLQRGLIHVRQTLARVRVHGPSEDGKKTRLVFQEPKTNQSRRTIPIPADIVEELHRHKARQAQERLLLGEAYDDHGLIFCTALGSPLEPVDFYRRFVRLLQQAGLPARRFHDARHTFATLMLELGESPKTVQTMLGHTTIATTLDIYSHVSLELEQRAAANLNAALRGIATPSQTARS
jgi:integrase